MLVATAFVGPIVLTVLLLYQSWRGAGYIIVDSLAALRDHWQSATTSALQPTLPLTSPSPPPASAAPSVTQADGAVGSGECRPSLTVRLRSLNSSLRRCVLGVPQLRKLTSEGPMRRVLCVFALVLLHLGFGHVRTSMPLLTQLIRTPQCDLAPFALP